MKNIIDYVREENRTFEEKELSRVDSLILCELSYVQVDRIFDVYKQKYDELKQKNNTLKNKIKNKFLHIFKHEERIEYCSLKFSDLLKQEYFNDMFGGNFAPTKDEELLKAVACSPRYRDIELAFYVSDTEPDIDKQFAAITYILNDKYVYVAFRGTDSSLAGWKEDFNISYACPVPAQTAAYEYLQTISGMISQQIYVGGHSKGGNLAIYSAMKCFEALGSRIKMCFSHDGPGFKKEIVESKEFLNIENLVCKTVPQDSLIGMLLQSHNQYQVIKSNAILIEQHDAFSWEVKNNDFVNVDDISIIAKYANSKLSQWIENMDYEKRKTFTETLFKILQAASATKLTDYKGNWAKTIPAMYEEIKNMDPDTKKMMKEIINSLAGLSFKNLQLDNK